MSEGGEATETRTGGCLCGAVRYRVDGPVRPLVACHCRQCRRQSGHHFVSTDVPREQITIEGEDAITWYRSSPTAQRGFCGTCGSVLFFAPADDQGLGVLAGSLDEPTGLRMAGHIFVAEKGDYYDIADGLPCRARGTADELVAEIAADSVEEAE